MIVKRAVGVASVAAALLASGGCSGTTPPTATEVPGAEATPVVWVSTLDRYASESAKDWATNADAVADVTVMAETQLAPAESEVSRGEGLLGRRITVQVNDVLWDNPRTRAELPRTIELNAFGWTFKGDETRTTRLAGRGTSRLEVGHRYVMGVVLLPAECSADEVNPATWAPIGGNGVVPFDQKVWGAGEYEGRTVTALPTQVPAEGTVDATLRDVVATSGVAALPRLLDDAPAGTRFSLGNECRAK